MATTIKFAETKNPRFEIMARRESRALALARNEARREAAKDRGGSR